MLLRGGVLPLKSAKDERVGRTCLHWQHMGKNGTIWHFSVLCFLLALVQHCLQMLCLPGFRTHANTQNLLHCRAFPASIQKHCPSKCLFFMANAKLPNRPGFSLLHVYTCLSWSCHTLWHKIITYEKLFWNNYFWKITNLTRNSLKKSLFSGHFERTKCLKNYEK